MMKEGSEKYRHGNYEEVNYFGDTHWEVKF